LTAFAPLSHFLTDIQETLDQEYAGNSYKIIAETTDVKVYWNRGYAFLTLVEKQGGNLIASAGAVIWRNNLPLIGKFEKATGKSFGENLELVLEVEVQYNVRYGMRLSIVDIDTAYTQGKIQQEKEKTLLALITAYPENVKVKEGVYTSSNQTLALPIVIQRIALIAAQDSDGRRDFLHELYNNEYGIGYSIAEFPAQVQGAASAGQIAAQLARINRSGGVFDAVAIVRGGGSNTDLSAFDDFQVAVNIALCPYPVFTGIGHERNVSITDMLAKQAAKTPTKCAATMTEHNLQFLGQMQETYGEIGNRAKQIQAAEVQNGLQLKEVLVKNIAWRLLKEKQTLQRQLDYLQVMQPENTLTRGYTLVYKENKIQTSSQNIQLEETVTIRWKDGNKQAKIIG
jgi:exodeoxyribonuclease VII large subunit